MFDSTSGLASSSSLHIRHHFAGLVAFQDGTCLRYGSAERDKIMTTDPMTRHSARIGDDTKIVIPQQHSYQCTNWSVKY